MAATLHSIRTHRIHNYNRITVKIFIAVLFVSQQTIVQINT